jgi:hypothetical protein
MAESTTRTHTPPTTNQNNSKNGSSTERSSGTGSGESSTNTPSARKKKGGGLGNHDTASNTGLAGLFASLCGGKKAKKAFDEEPLSSRHTGSRPITGVSQHSGSKAPPAAPVTTKQVSPDIEVTTAKRLSTGETDTSKPTIATAQSPMSSERVADGTANGTQMINGSETNSANQQPGTEGHGIQSSSTDNQNELASNGHVAGSEKASGSLAPALIGAAATGVGAAVVSSASGGLNIPQSQDQETGDIGENDNTVNGATQKLNDLHLPNDVIVSTGHPLPLEEVRVTIQLLSAIYAYILIPLTDGRHDFSCCSGTWIRTNLRPCNGTTRSSSPPDSAHITSGNSSFQHPLTITLTERSESFSRYNCKQRHFR